MMQALDGGIACGVRDLAEGQTVVIWYSIVSGRSKLRLQSSDPAGRFASPDPVAEKW